MRLPSRRLRRESPAPYEDPFAVDLEARVDQAFAPDATAFRRIREHVTGEFRVAAAAARRGDAPGRARWSLPLRPVAAFLLAAILLAGSVGLAAANSGAGQPFYGLRLATEELTLPASGAARVQAQLARLDQRLVEAQRGAQAGDAGAVAAALAAYRSELTDTLTRADAEGVDIGAVLERLAVHQGVLDALSGTLPAAAAHGIQEALDQVGRAVDRLRSLPTSSPPGLTPEGTPHPTPSHPTPAPGGGPPSGVPGASHRP
jgi:hypothetical protein